jgi:hypothetical protein
MTALHTELKIGKGMKRTLGDVCIEKWCFTFHANSGAQFLVLLTIPGISLGITKVEKIGQVLCSGHPPLQDSAEPKTQGPY